MTASSITVSFVDPMTSEFVTLDLDSTTFELTGKILEGQGVSSIFDLDTFLSLSPKGRLAYSGMVGTPEITMQTAIKIASEAYGEKYLSKMGLEWMYERAAEWLSDATF